MCNDRRMNSFQDFVNWAGGTRRAAKQLGTSAARVSRIKNSKQPVTPEIAAQCEHVSHGLFRKEKILWPEEVMGTKTEQGA